MIIFDQSRESLIDEGLELNLSGASRVPLLASVYIEIDYVIHCNASI
jgi:hypothetical protein